MTWRGVLARLGLRPHVARAKAQARAVGDPSVPTGTADVSEGTVVGGRYRLRQLIGRGASGAVHLAIDDQTGRQVAIKLMPRASRAPLAPDIVDDPGAREWRAARRLDHPGIVALIDAGSDPRWHWTVSEFAAGVGLQRYTQASRLLPEALVLQIGAQLCSALAHAHRQGIVHRDLKPANVILHLPTGRIKVLDFGVARVDDGAATRTGMTLGTPSYMAPEQLAGAPASAAGDAYAIGIILFELLAGRRPHEGATLGALLRAVGAGEAARLCDLRPDLDAAVVDGVNVLLQPDPGRRCRDLVAHAERLQALAHPCLAPSPPAAVTSPTG